MTTKHLTTAWLLLVLLVAASSNPARAAPAARPEPGLTVSGVCIDCRDGDTVTIEIVARVRVRLLDCWAAELNTQQGKNAQKFAEKLALHKPVILFVPQGKRSVGDSFSFDRALGYVWVEGDEMSLSERLVEAKYATKERPK